MSILSIDFETRSTVDLKESGVYVYASNPDTGIWCMAWAFDDEEVEIWVPGSGLPDRILTHVYEKRPLRAWNAQFERVIWQEIMVPRHAAFAVDSEQWYCTMAEAAAMALPQSLDMAATVLGLKHKKDNEGYREMLRMARPRKVDQLTGEITWWDIPERKARLYEYCKQDVRVERAAAKVSRRLSPHERQVYLLDQRINARGLCVDRDLIAAAQTIVIEGTARANDALVRLTDGAVDGVTKNTQLVAWLNANGVETDSVAKPKVAELLEGPLTPVVREALELRAENGRTSVAKLRSMTACAGVDNRVRGLLQYHAAGTGRWGGRLVQPQNFPRGEIEKVESLIPEVMMEDYDWLSLFAPPIPTVLSLLRSMLTAGEGNVLSAGDFAAVEARVLNWIAGQEDILSLFAAMDAGDKSKHPYKVMAVKMGRAATASEILKPSEDYQAGKAAELGCGFQMAGKKFVDAAWKVYQVRVTVEQAIAAVKAYRESHPKVVELWKATEQACLTAIQEPGVVITFGGRRNLRAVTTGAYLYLILPSGRPIAYAAPRAKMHTVRIAALVAEDGKEIEPAREFTKLGVEFSGVEPLTKQWGRMRAYGGLLVENIVQGTARDLMADAMLRLDGRGYPPVLSVHDEVVSETAGDFGSLEEFLSILAEVPAWASGCPVAVEGWRGFRYRK